MTEAVYNAAGLGLPVVMTLANRAVGAPINIWNDHSDAMALRDAGWIQLFAEDNQEAADLHVQAFAIAEELSVPVMVCVDGFVLTHAVEGVDLPDQAQVDALLAPYEPRQVLDPDHPISIGAMVGPEAFAEVRYLAHLRQLDALGAIPRAAAAFAAATGRDSGGLVRPYRVDDADVVVVAMGSILGTLKDAVDARRDAGDRVGVLGVTTFRPFPADALAEALTGATRVVVVEKAFSVGVGGVLSARRRRGGARRHRAHRGRRARRPAGAARRPRGARRARRGGRARRRGVPGPRHRRRRARARAHRRVARLGPDGREPAARPLGGPRPGGVVTKVRFYQVGSFAVGNRLLGAEDRTVQSDAERANSIDSGHRACQGCGEALGARYALDAAMRATGGRLVAVNATGCLEVFSTPFPETSWRIAWLHSLFGNAAAVATGVAAALRVTGREDVRVVAQAGDGGTVDIGFGCLSGMFERNDDVLFVCYDNEGYMNTGVQRSAATPPAARTATTEAVGPEPGNAFGQGKDLPRLAMAHDIPYVATATVADLHDLERKVERAMSVRGARYLHVLVPCPLGWGSASGDTIRLARLAAETGLFPVFEAERGRVTSVSAHPPPHPGRGVPAAPAAATPTSSPARAGPTSIARLQAIADANIERYGLVDAETTRAP